MKYNTSRFEVFDGVADIEARTAGALEVAPELLPLLLDGFSSPCLRFLGVALSGLSIWLTEELTATGGGACSILEDACTAGGSRSSSTFLLDFKRFLIFGSN